MSDQKQPEKEPDLTNESENQTPKESFAVSVEQSPRSMAFYQYQNVKVFMENMNSMVKEFAESQKETAKLQVEGQEKAAKIQAEGHKEAAQMNLEAAKIKAQFIQNNIGKVINYAKWLLAAVVLIFVLLIGAFAYHGALENLSQLVYSFFAAVAAAFGTWGFAKGKNT